MKESKEFKNITQNYMVWLIKVLLTFSAWVVCSFLIYFGLQFLKIVSPDYFLPISIVLSAVLVGLAYIKLNSR